MISYEFLVELTRAIEVLMLGKSTEHKFFKTLRKAKKLCKDLKPLNSEDLRMSGVRASVVSIVARVSKWKEYVSTWDSERYGFVKLELDGRLVPSNNNDLDGLYLDKPGLERLIECVWHSFLQSDPR